MIPPRHTRPLCLNERQLARVRKALRTISDVQFNVQGSELFDRDFVFRLLVDNTALLRDAAKEFETVTNEMLAKMP